MKMHGIAATVALLLASGSAAAADPRSTMERIRDPKAGLIVAAHRGCHEAAPYHGLPAAPENSVLALEHCVTLGVDIMETDVHRSKDGYLVMMHDDAVDRTTNGHGFIRDLTLAQLKALRLKDNLGGDDAALTDQRILTLDEMLDLARGKIVLNLDVKDMIYPEVIEAVLRKQAADRVIVKAYAGIGSAQFASMPPYDSVPFMPLLTSADETAKDLPGVIDAQFTGERKPLGFELPRMPAESLPAIAEKARGYGVRLWLNSLWDGFLRGGFGDKDALRKPDAVWGELYRRGVSMIQTDEPEALLRFRSTIAK